MSERPILFSGAMIRAILSSAKTQTRRIVKPQPQTVTDTSIEPWQGDATVLQRLLDASGRGCPHGKPGDRLAVRETWRYCGWTEDGLPFVEYQADGAQSLCDRGISEEWAEKLGDIWADLSAPQNFELDGRAADRRWRPSIHMPRWASRLTLEITGVRVERLQAISAADAMEEGVAVHADHFNKPIGHPCSPVMAYRDLWEYINGPGSWDANPWVWVVEFRRIVAQEARAAA